MNVFNCSLLGVILGSWKLLIDSTPDSIKGNKYLVIPSIYQLSFICVYENTFSKIVDVCLSKNLMHAKKLYFILENYY